MWMSFVGGKLNVYSFSHELQSASEKRVPSAMIQSALLHFRDHHDPIDGDAVAAKLETAQWRCDALCRGPHD